MNKKVLIIDDDEEMCAELTEILSDEGYEVRVALNGSQGKELMEKEWYGAVILDLKLPGLNGYEVLKRAKQKPGRSKIIVLSGRPMATALNEANGSQDKEEEALKLADAVMNKPVAIPLLLDKVRQYTLSAK